MENTNDKNKTWGALLESLFGGSDPQRTWEAIQADAEQRRKVIMESYERTRVHSIVCLCRVCRPDLTAKDLPCSVCGRIVAAGTTEANCETALLAELALLHADGVTK